ncbi:hypothetical protein ACFVHQ_13500 [Actinomycetes bacterium NPDC127524]
MKIEKFKLCQQPANKPAAPRAVSKPAAVNDERKQMKEFLYKMKKSSSL